MKLTTEKHLAAFEKEARYWISKLGLLDWELSFKREVLDNSRGMLRVNYLDRCASFFLCKEWTDPNAPLTIANVRDCGKHEAIELLISDLATIANSRFVTDDEWEQTRHSLVQRLMGALQR